MEFSRIIRGFVEFSSSIYKAKVLQDSSESEVGSSELSLGTPLLELESSGIFFFFDEKS